ncbi:MAG TPA: prepilin-type N-terminal cleavage/methylation domain-containing protein [Verrucomicrobiae bacterium]|nr:prepilin-type N-terminal cleavage/methylation domain-containing protein [Verrucomicrobiae bacterium]
MKLPIAHNLLKQTTLSRAGHTLVEMLVSMSIFSLAIAGILACHLAGLRFNWFIQPKIENAQYTRQTISRIVEEVRCASSVQVGSGTLTNFTPAGATNIQAGNALRVYPSTNSTQYIYYYHDPSSACLNRVSLFGGPSVPIATMVTNDNVFEMEDFSGTVLTNSQNNAVLGILLQMRRDLNMGGASDAFQIVSKITRRGIL